MGMGFTTRAPVSYTHLDVYKRQGYAEAIRAAYPAVPASADYVTYWWHTAAGLARAGALRRFGLIATNSLRQTFNRRVLQSHLDGQPPLSLLFAIPDHPWVDTADGAAVRISMTAGAAGAAEGRLLTVVGERGTDSDTPEITTVERVGRIQADLTIGADVVSAVPLKANLFISNRGIAVLGDGFVVTKEQAVRLGLGRIPTLEKHIRPLRNGRDLTASSRDMWAIDLLGLTINEVQSLYPEVYQWILERVKPERDQNRRDAYRRNWWIFGEARSSFRPALKQLERYIVTPMTAKHRNFLFLDSETLPDQGLVAIALDDAYFLGVLSSQVHVLWALAVGCLLYTSRCV